MDTERIKKLTVDLESLKSVEFYTPNAFFIGFRTSFMSAFRERVIRPSSNPTGNDSILLSNELNEAIKPVIDKWIKKKEIELRRELEL